MRVRLRGIQGVLRIRGDSPTQDGGQEQWPGAGRRAVPWTSVDASTAPFYLCDWDKLSNLSVPWFLSGNMGMMNTPT